jgi:hypothetical protein
MLRNAGYIKTSPKSVSLIDATRPQQGHNKATTINMGEIVFNTSSS